MGCSATTDVDQGVTESVPLLVAGRGGGDSGCGGDGVQEVVVLREVLDRRAMVVHQVLD